MDGGAELQFDMCAMRGDVVSRSVFFNLHFHFSLIL